MTYKRWTVSLTVNNKPESFLKMGMMQKVNFHAVGHFGSSQWRQPCNKIINVGLNVERQIGNVIASVKTIIHSKNGR